MSPQEEDQLDADVPEMAVRALTAAHQRALQAGHVIVRVQDGYLVRIDHTGVTILKKLPPRATATSRIKMRHND